MTEETRIIIKNKLIKCAKDSFNETSELDKAARITFILGARKLLLLLSENNVLDFNAIKPLFDELDTDKVKL